MFKDVEWQYTVIEDASRVRKDAKTLEGVKGLTTDFITFVTSTALHENADEIWPILNIISPAKYGYEKYCTTG